MTKSTRVWHAAAAQDDADDDALLLTMMKQMKMMITETRAVSENIAQTFDSILKLRHYEAATVVATVDADVAVCCCFVAQFSFYATTLVANVL